MTANPTPPAPDEARRLSDGLRTIATNMRSEGLGGSRPDVLDEAAALILALCAALPPEGTISYDDLRDAYTEQLAHTNLIRASYQSRIKALEEQLASLRAALEAGEADDSDTSDGQIIVSYDRWRELLSAEQHSDEYRAELERVALECGHPELWQSAAETVRGKLLHYDELEAEHLARLTTTARE